MGRLYGSLGLVHETWDARWKEDSRRVRQAEWRFEEESGRGGAESKQVKAGQEGQATRASVGLVPTGAWVNNGFWV